MSGILGVISPGLINRKAGAVVMTPANPIPIGNTPPPPPPPEVPPPTTLHVVDVDDAVEISVDAPLGAPPGVVHTLDVDDAVDITMTAGG